MKYALPLALLAAITPVVAQDPEGDAIALESLIAWVGKHGGRKFAYSDEVAGLFAKRKITLDRGALDEKRAYESGLALLRLGGLAAIPQEGGTVQLVTSNRAAREALRVYTSADALPKADEFCCLTVTLRHASTRDVHAALINVMQPQGVVPVEGAGAIVLNDYASNLRKAAEILKQLDVPRRANAYRVSVAVLEGTGGEASVPDAFKGVDLSFTNRSRFTLLSEGLVRIDAAEAAPPARAVPGAPAPLPQPTEAMMRFGGARPIVVELAGFIRRDDGPTLERVTVRDDADRSQVGARLLETRLEPKEGAWTLAGAVPTDKDGVSLVVLVRAVRADK